LKEKKKVATENEEKVIRNTGDEPHQEVERSK
jgi:hypothetical protein